MGSRFVGPELQVFFDADCGMCAHLAKVLRRLDEAHRLELLPLQRASEHASDAPPQAALLDAMHVRDRAGIWTKGGEAWIRIAHAVPVMRPLALVARLPLVRSLVEPVYGLVAANRGRISHLMGEDKCRLDGSVR